MAGLNKCREAKGLLLEAVEKGQIPSLGIGIGRVPNSDEFAVEIRDGYETQFPPSYYADVISILGGRGLTDVHVNYVFTEAEAH